MKFIQMMDQPVEPGGLVEWSPSTVGGFAHWENDPRSTSHNHELHLRSSLEHRWRTKREGGRESWLGLAIEFDEPMSVPAIRSALTRWIDRHEVLRSHVVVKHSGLQRLTTPPGSVRLKMGRVGWYAESGPLLDQLAGSFDRATAPLQWPAYLFATVARERTFTLLFAGDHSLLDGYSLILAQHELSELYHAARERREPQLPEVGSYVDFSAHERRVADDADVDHPAVTAWAEFLDAHDRTMPRFDLVAPASETGDVTTAEAAGAAPSAETDGTDQGPPQSSVTLELLDDDAANRFTAVCAATGGSLFAGILAALAVSYRECGGGDVFCCITPRHTRTEGRWLGALGWFVSTTPVAIDSAGTRSFASVVQRATAALRRTRVAADVPFLRVTELLGYGDAPTFVVSFIDTRHAPDAAAADAGGARVLRSHNYSPDEVYIWVNRTPSGVRISARFPARGPMHSAVSGFLVRFSDVVRAVGDRSTFAAQ
ncbi:condensation domain-containing protein [Williamsia deligens]|uniref:Condensation domain-containing protein n=1 Tax=Williamsia deligens TaxID=321325 RepID=A0ABW3GAP7_9NOCA|nr:condensation domain-containing protein [Williamsia deligens]MCP2196174.1 Condensation domain-containing protein [Williamsia deligens]